MWLSHDTGHLTIFDSLCAMSLGFIDCTYVQNALKNDLIIHANRIRQLHIFWASFVLEHYFSLEYTGTILIGFLFFGAVLIPVIRPTKVKTRLTQGIR